MDSDAKNAWLLGWDYFCKNRQIHLITSQKLSIFMLISKLASDLKYLIPKMCATHVKFYLVNLLLSGLPELTNFKFTTLEVK